MATIAEINDELFGQLDDPSMYKNAAETMNKFIRRRVREDGFYRKVIPMEQKTNADLDRQVVTDKPSIVLDMEPESPAAVSIPFGKQPVGWYIMGRRVLLSFSRITTDRFIKDLGELRDYEMDIRQVISDNAIKDMLAEEDSKFLTTVNSALGGAADTVIPSTGIAQWQTVSGGITRDTVAESLAIMPQTPAHFNVQSCLVNNVTVYQFLKWGRDEVGGDMSQDMLKRGWAAVDGLLGVDKWHVTLKRDLVPDDTVYMFAAPEVAGVSYMLEDVTMYAKKEAWMIEFFMYEEIGGLLPNVSALVRVDYT